MPFSKDTDMKSERDLFADEVKLFDKTFTKRNNTDDSQ